MTADCLRNLKLRRLEEKIAERQKQMQTLQGADKRKVLSEISQLTSELTKMKQDEAKADGR